MVYYNFYYVQADGVSDINECELEYLRELLFGRSFEYYLEVGIGYMGTLCNIAKAIVENDKKCKCIGIDSFGELPGDIRGNNTHQGDVVRLEDANKLLSELQLHNIVTLHKGDSGMVLEKVLRPIRSAGKLLFIDANHTYEGCLSDFRAAHKYLAAGDIITFHDTLHLQHPDYGRGPRGVIEDHLLSNPRYRLLRFPGREVTLNGDVNTIGAFEVL